MCKNLPSAGGAGAGAPSAGAAGAAGAPRDQKSCQKHLNDGVTIDH